MVLPLRPSKFYGSSLPRPRIYNDIKFNAERVDPPLGVTAPLMSWAKDAPWSMGGLSHDKKRMAGKIEGNLIKLKDDHEEDSGKQIRESEKAKEGKSPARKQIRESEKPKEVKSPARKQITERFNEKEGKYSARKLIREREKGKEGKSPAKSSSESETPARVICTPLFDKSPSDSQLIKQKWASEDNLEDDDNPSVVPESIEKLEKKRAPHVLKRIRRLGDAFNEQALAAGSDRVFESPNVRSATRSASKKRQLGNESEVLDFVGVPEKILKSASPRRNLKEKGESPVTPIRRSARTVAVASKRLAA